MVKVFVYILFVAFTVSQTNAFSLQDAWNYLTASERLSTQEDVCTADGFFRDSENCESFIWCSNGIRHSMLCPEGLHFNVKNAICESPCDAECDKTLACQCGWPYCMSTICHLPTTPGRCKGHYPRWAFDVRSSKCEQFIYGGCEGNANNFNSKEICDELCDVCTFEKDAGPCKANETRYYFDEKEKRCIEFIYGGCQGNENNFKTKKQCERKCLKRESWENSEEFTCAADGVYPVPERCSVYAQCLKGEAHFLPCPSGLHYSTQTEQCELPCNAFCDQSLACDCEWPSCK